MPIEQLTRRGVLKAGAALVGATALDTAGIPGRPGIVFSAPEKSPALQIIPLVTSIRLPDGTRAIFDRRANGMGDNPATNTDPKGYVMAGPILDAYENNGGDAVWGPIISQQFTDALGRKTQYTQRGGFQITVDRQGRVENTEYDNIFDRLREAEVDLDNEENMIPKYVDWSSDSNFTWGRDETGGLPGTIEDNHIQKIFNQPQLNITPREQTLLKDKFFSNKKWFEQFGLPMGTKKYTNGVVAVVAQRAGFHLWPDATPWSQKDEPVVVLGGDVLKKLVQQGTVTRYVDKQVFATQENPFPQVGETTATETPPQPGLILETLQTGKGKQTEWVIQKSPDSPVTPVVQRPDALNHVADTYLPRTGLKKVEIKFLPVFEGFKYNGLDFGPLVISLSDTVTGPDVRIKYASVQNGDTLSLFYSIREDNSLELMKATADAQDRVDRNLATSIGTRIAEAGGYPIFGAGRVAPEAAALGDKPLTAAIRLVTS